MEWEDTRERDTKGEIEAEGERDELAESEGSNEVEGRGVSAVDREGEALKVAQ